MPESKRAAAYIRVSTEEQTEFSPDAQLRAIRKYCGEKGICLLEKFIFKDEGISARTAEGRPAFMRMIACAKAVPKPFDMIIVHRFDRFSRSREDSVVYKSLLRKQCGIRVVSVTEQMQDDKFSIILESMLEAMAEYYSLNLGDEVRKGMTEKALRGELQTPAPLGYKMEDGTLMPDSASVIIKEIFELAADGLHPPAVIAKHLTEKGCLTKRGNPFSARAVCYVLRNPVYKGFLRWFPDKKKQSPPIIVEGQHEAIVSPQLWQMANDALCKKKASPHRREYSPLEGILRCAACGSLMYPCGQIFRCGRYLNGNCPHSQGISAKKIETLVKEEFKKDFEELFHHCDDFDEFFRSRVDRILFDKEGKQAEIIYKGNKPPNRVISFA